MPDRIFADTNIFIRFYRQDDPVFSPKAEKIILGCEKNQYNLVICAVTILEIVWLLTSFYKLPKKHILEFIQKILEIKNIQITDKDLAEKTISIYKESNLDATDAYLAALMEQEKIKKIFSFDHDLDKISGIKRLEV